MMCCLFDKKTISKYICKEFCVQLNNNLLFFYKSIFPIRHTAHQEHYSKHKRSMEWSIFEDVFMEEKVFQVVAKHLLSTATEILFRSPTKTHSFLPS